MNKIKRIVYAILIMALTSAACNAETAGTAGQKMSGNRVTLNFRDSSIQEVFDVLSRKDKVNIILGQGVSGQVSVNLYDITVQDAIYRVAEAAGLNVEQRRNGDYVILKRSDVGLDHPDGLTQLRTFKVHYSDPKQVADILAKYLSRFGKITPLNNRRMIVIEDTPEFIARASKLLQELDVQPRQVLIEAKVLEITLNDGEAYGVDWSHIFGSAANANGTFGTNGLATGSVAGGPKMAGFFFSMTNGNLKLFLEASETKNRVRTLSTPKLLAMENQEAKAVIGNSTGYKVTTTINQVTTESIQFLESGVILRVTPSVDQQGRVLLKVHPEVSSTTLNAGIPRRGIYDNMKTAVDRVNKGKGRVVNARFAVMCAHYLFDADFCNVASGWEKGVVEKNVQDSRRRIWLDAQNQRFGSFEELNVWLGGRCRSLWRELHHPVFKGLSVAEMLEQEQALMMPMPTPFDGYVTDSVKVSSTCLVTVQCNRYSVPCEWAGQPVDYRIYPTQICVVAGDSIVATHDRLTERDNVRYDWQHYISLVERKPGALRNGAPFADMPAPLLRLRKGLMRDSGGDKIMAQVLSVIPSAGLNAVLVAVELVLESGAISAEHVINVVARLKEGPVPDCVETSLQLKEAPLANTSRYDTLRDTDESGVDTTEVSHA